MFNFKVAMFNSQRLNPESRLLNLVHRATAKCETRKNPEFFPNYFKNDQISRVSFEVDNLTS